MPGIITHHIHGEQVKKLLSDNFTSINADAFAWGTQGADFFNAHKSLPPPKGTVLKEFGAKFHQADPMAVINSMKKVCRDEISMSYLWGFCCHCALDSAAQPYILYLADKLKGEYPEKDESGLYNEIEASIDTIMLRREYGKLPSEINPAEYLPENAEAQNSAARLYRLVIKDIFDEDISEATVIEAMSDAKKFYKALKDKTGLKKGLLKKLGRPIASNIMPMFEDGDYANINRNTWNYKDGRESEQDFFELFDIAVQTAVNIINGLNDHDISAHNDSEPFC